MAVFTFNPYPQIGTELTAGMDAVAGALTPTSTIDDLANAIYNYVQPIYYPTSPIGVPKQIEIEIKSVVYNIANAYNNKSLGTTLMYKPSQMNIIRMMLGQITTELTPINALGSWLLDIEDNVSKDNLPLDIQTPLLLGIDEGEAIYAYWIAKVATPGTWAPFFDPREPHNYANIPLWTAACMEGGLIGANATQQGLIAPTTDITSVNIISSLIGALTVGAGKVIFKWVPRIQPAELIRSTVLQNGLNGALLGGFNPLGGGGNFQMMSGTHEQCINKYDCRGGDNTGGCTNEQLCFAMQTA